MTKRRTILLSLWAALFVGWAQPVTTPGHSVIDDAGAPLRARFNQYTNKVRLVLLLSPT
jgi:hypothetical protein